MKTKTARNYSNTMARLLLLFIAAMILAAHASLIPGVSQFLKLDYLTKLVKLYACFHELKLLSDFPLLASNVLPAKTKTE